MAFELDKPCIDGCAAKLLRLDPNTMHIEQSQPIDPVAAGLAVVGNVLWLPVQYKG